MGPGIVGTDLCIENRDVIGEKIKILNNKCKIVSDTDGDTATMLSLLSM